MTTVHSDFIYRISERKKLLMIVDLDEGRMSVTNDIENIVLRIRELTRQDTMHYTVYYRDSEQDWWKYLPLTDGFRNTDNDETQIMFDNLQYE